MGEGPMGKILYLPRFGMILTLELLGRIGNVWTGFCQGRENTCIYYGQGFLQRFAMTLHDYRLRNLIQSNCILFTQRLLVIKYESDLATGKGSI